MNTGTETIVAISTPPGRGAIGVVRWSGEAVPDIARTMFGRLPPPRLATLCEARSEDGQVLDSGLLLYFPKPRSYTGEPMLEFHGHGGPVVLKSILARGISAGARMAEPGEFSQRAFLNGKLDLVQAEAVADLIDSGSESAALAAVRSLKGEFSARVDDLQEQLTALRIQVEAGIDFPDDEIDTLADPQVQRRLDSLLDALGQTRSAAREGVVLTDGVRLLLAGRPNAGKSSLMNALLGEDRAIVSATPGTTRDVVDARFNLDGLPVTAVDTAGLRPTGDEIEVQGVERALREQQHADLILEVVDDSQPDLPPIDFPDSAVLIRVFNKIDLSGRPAGQICDHSGTAFAISALGGAGLRDLKSAIKRVAGLTTPESSLFSARSRHLSALDETYCHLELAAVQIRALTAEELVAEELRLAQRALSAITGAFSTEELLGKIFSSFCIGK